METLCFKSDHLINGSYRLHVVLSLLFNVMITGEVHHVDQFHSLDNLKNQFTSVAFCMNSEACNVRNGSVIDFPVVVLIGGFPRC